MTLTQAQKDKFAESQSVYAALTVADLEASTKANIKQWGVDWWNYVLSDTAPGFDRPPNKPPHP